MKLTETATYTGAGPEAVFALISDEGFRGHVCERIHATSYEVDVDGDPSGPVTVSIARTMPAELPDFIKKMIGETVHVTQVERWDAPDAEGARTGSVDVAIKGQPAGMTGSMRLVRAGEDTQLVLDGDVTVKIPFVGKKIEPEVAKAIVMALRTEAKEGQKRL